MAPPGAFFFAVLGLPMSYDWRMIDSHCHLDLPCFDAQRAEISARCLALGVEAIVVPGITAGAWPKLLETCATDKMLWPALGLHPCFLCDHSVTDVGHLERLVDREQLCAVGEIGLDFFRGRERAQEQIELFSAQLEIAASAQLPVLLHVRRAHDEMISLLRGAGFSLGGVVHAFSGSLVQAQRYIDIGFKLGFGGTITYPRATRLRHLITQLPIDQIVLETDAPDMAPAFARGEHNSPENLPGIAAVIADLVGISNSSLTAITTRNTKELLCQTR